MESYLVDNELFIQDTTRDISRGKNRFARTLQASSYNTDGTLSTANGLESEGIAKEQKSLERGEYQGLEYTIPQDTGHAFSDIKFDREKIAMAVESLKAKGYNFFDFPYEPFRKQPLTESELAEQRLISNLNVDGELHR